MDRRCARAVLLALGLVCAGCRLDLDIAADVARNGSGRLTVSLTADDELLRRAAKAGADPLGDLVRAGRDLERDGWRTQQGPGSDGGRTVTLDRGFADPGELAALTRELDVALSAAEVDLLDVLRLELTDDEVRLRGAAGLRPRRAVRDYGLSPRQAVRLLERSEAFGYTVRARMPGDVVRASGTVDDREVVWVVPPGERVTLDAVAERPAPVLLRAVVGGAVGALAGVAVLAVLAVLRRRRRSLRDHHGVAESVSSPA